MSKKLFLGCIAIALLLVSNGARTSEPDASFEEGMNAVLQVERELPVGADPGPPLEAAFARYFGDVAPGALEPLSDDAVAAYFRAAETVAFYTFDRQYLAVLESAFLEMESRGKATDFDVTTMFKSYVEYREFAKAKALAALYPRVDLEALPGVRLASHDQATVLALQPDGSIAQVPAALSTKGPQVVVAAHPLCHFSDNAVRAIGEDSELASLFRGHTLWLMPQSRQMDIDVVRDWNRDHPDYAMRWAYQTSDWPMIKRWATPNFYFYLDGELVETVIGWPPEGQRDALLAAFAKIGLAPAATDQRSR